MSYVTPARLGKFKELQDGYNEEKFALANHTHATTDTLATEEQIITLFDANFGTVTITQKANQTITVTCGGKSYTTSFREILGEEWEASVVADSGYKAGTLSATYGIVDNTAIVTVGDAINIAKLLVLDDITEINYNTMHKNGIDTVREYIINNNITTLSSDMLPSSIASIGAYAFYSCTKLTYVEIPSSVTSIGASAFEECENLDIIKISNNTSVITFGGDAFYTWNRDTVIKVPNSLLTQYQSTYTSYTFAGY